MGQYAESFVEPARENETITILQEQMKALDQKMAGKADDITDLQNFSLFPEMRLLVGFKLPHIEKIYRNTPLHLHLRVYIWTMQLYGLSEAHLA